MLYVLIYNIIINNNSANVCGTPVNNSFMKLMIQII